MPLTKDQLAQQQKQAEELLFSGPQKLGFAKGLFFGHFNAPLLFPYPVLRPEERAVVDAKAGVFVPPQKRNLGMVFQSYAIWPHMTVFENVA